MSILSACLFSLAVPAGRQGSVLRPPQHYRYLLAVVSFWLLLTTLSLLGQQFSASTHSVTMVAICGGVNWPC